MTQEAQATNQNIEDEKATPKQSSYSAVIQKMNNIIGQYSSLPMDSIFSAFGRAFGGYWANQPSVQNSRLKMLNPLPCDYSKEELNQFLVNPQNSELPLQQVGEGLKWSNYSWYKLIKSYADMLQFHTMVLPQHATTDEIKSDGFKREYRLVNKVIKALKPREIGRKTAMQAGTQGKVFYVPRSSVDKSHNKINYFFMQPLPKQWCTIIGQNSVSEWTISFNLMYFMTPGTDYRQFGDLFEPYMSDFNDWLTADQRKAFKGKYIYASRNNAEFESEVKAWQQNGRWFYYVSLPIERVWTFEIDGSTAIVASPFSGLMQTFAQQADYEAAQLSLVLNPLIKIFTGEIPYYKSSEAKEDDGYRLSIGGRALFEALWNQLMVQNNTGGTAFFSAPVENIKSHDYGEAANANDVSNSFLTYSANKTGLNALIPITENPHQGVAEYSAKLEAQFAQRIYDTFSRMVNYILESLNLNYEWNVKFFGDIYSDELVRSHALKLIDKGDLYGWVLLSSLDDISIYERVNINQIVSDSGLMELLQVPQSAYTQSNKSQPKSDTGGAPQKDESAVEQTKIEKQTESAINE